MSEKATPRPWLTNAMWIMASGKTVADCGVGRESEADAALIVRAVNAHDDLVGALRELVSLIPKKFTTAPAFDNARAVLAALDDSEPKP